MFENQNSALNHLMYQNNHMQKYTSPVIIVEPEASIHDTLLQMQTNFIKRIVVASKNKPVGVVTERDISKFLEQDKTAKALDEIPIKYVMKKEFVTFKKNYSLKFALNNNNKNNISRLIVTDNKGKPEGIITTNNFLTHSDYFSKGTTRTRDYLLPLKSQNLQVKDLLTEDVL